MNRLGMLIDVSHLSDRGFYDVAELSKQPFVASHSNARSLTPHSRSLTDDMIKVLADHGGVIGLNFCGAFLGDSEISRVEDMVSHILHIRQVGGTEVIALGTDFDGISPELEIEDMGQIGKLIRALERAGFTDAELDKFLWQNSLRVIQDSLK
jgi:membrane dipeptidase